ncbi:hypothetical protein AB0M46_00215 [Dactylosporangium sp. NPDC051485]|uniref:hypothetical protein n=1 Tax=Dactylosporangium sp. NPDC051485 TaxID=3154846 RepID=UPI003441985F
MQQRLTLIRHPQVAVGGDALASRFAAPDAAHGAPSRTFLEYDSDVLLQARLARAARLHAVGCCGDAVRQATAVWRAWTAGHSCTSPASQLLALRLAGMLTACQRIREADHLIAEADLSLADPHSPLHAAYRRYLTVGAAERVLHRQRCARLLGSPTTRPSEHR